MNLLKFRHGFVQEVHVVVFSGELFSYENYHYYDDQDEDCAFQGHVLTTIAVFHHLKLQSIPNCKG